MRSAKSASSHAFLPFPCLLLWVSLGRPDKRPRPGVRDSMASRLQDCTGTPPKSAARENAAVLPDILPKPLRGSPFEARGNRRCAVPSRNPALCRCSVCLVLGSPRRSLSRRSARCKNFHPTSASPPPMYGPRHLRFARSTRRPCDNLRHFLLLRNLPRG